MVVDRTLIMGSRQDKAGTWPALRPEGHKKGRGWTEAGQGVIQGAGIQQWLSQAHRGMVMLDQL